MKLTRVFLLSALAVLAACTKNQDIPDNDGMTTIKAINPQVKTITEDGVNVMWENGDEVALFVSGGVGDATQSALYKTNITNPAATATFVLTNDKEPVKQDENYLAIYPASQLYVWNTAGKKKCAMFLPPVQTVSSPGWDKRASLMASSSTTNEFTFKHCVSYVKFTVTSSSPAIKSFKVASGNSTEWVASKVSVAIADDNTVTLVEANQNVSAEATLSMENGEVFPAGTYYVAILSKTYESGLVFSCVDAEGKTFGTKKTPADLTMDAGAVGNYGEIKATASSSINPLVTIDLFNRPTRVSIIGDSISTFEGTLVTNFPNSENGGAYYPIYDKETGLLWASEKNVTSVTEQYWYKIIQKMSNAAFEVNNSLRGSMVVRRTQSNYLNADFTARTAVYGIGNPDVVLINGGTNDCTKHSDTYTVRPGMYRADMLLSDAFLKNSFDAGFVDNPAYTSEPYKGMAPTTIPTDDELNKVYAAAEAADTWDEILALEDRSYIHSYVKLLNMIHFKHPRAKVVMIIPDGVTKRCWLATVKIAEHYGQKYGYKYVNFYVDGQTSNANITKASGVHPDGNGFTYMANEIYSQVGSYIDAK